MLTATKELDCNQRCDGLVPWSLTLLFRIRQESNREHPRGEPMASARIRLALLAANVTLHGTSPWHQTKFSHPLECRV
jgi:hypothetical protein